MSAHRGPGPHEGSNRYDSTDDSRPRRRGSRHGRPALSRFRMSIIGASVGILVVVTVILLVSIVGSPGATRPTASRPVATPNPFHDSGAPSSPPVTWCETGLPASPYTSAPAGAVTVPAGDNGSFNFGTPNTTYWFAPGTHTLGTNSNGQVDTADGDTYVGAPGAVLDGQNANQYAFIGNYQDVGDENVKIEYLTIENFHPSQGGGAVNGNGNNGWTEKYDLMKDNSPGAAMMLGGDNLVSDNCLTENGEYGFNGYSQVDETLGSTFTGGATNITFTGNDVSANNTQKTQAGIEGGGKFWQNGNVTVTGNYVHNNIDSPGLWMDTDNAGFLVRDNYISGNDGEGLMFEISYNADIIDNTFIDNAIAAGKGNKSFPTGAIYISESGGDASVPSRYAGELNIEGNVFQNNWSGVVIYQNANRHPGDGQDPGTLTPPDGTSVGTWINDAPSTCPSHLSQTSPVDYHSLCQWRSQNVTVQGNTFQFNPSDSSYGGQCTEANSCGQNALFSGYSSTSAYPVWSVCNAISNKQNDHFKHNTYTGPWTFTYFNQGDTESSSAWRAGATNVQGSGDNFAAQDQGSTFTS
jgi:Periplasmic copper-binding protein (NosD)